MDSSNLGPGVLAVSWVFGALAIIIVGTRYYVRLRIVERFTIDDWLIALVLILALFNGIFYTLSVHHGLGRSLQTLTKNQISNTKKWVYFGNIFSTLSAGFGRIAFAFLLLALLHPVWSKRRGLLWTIITLKFIVDVLAVVVSFLQCRPMSGYWDKDVNATCMTVAVVRVTYFQGAFCALVDFVLAVFPISLLWNLQMKLKMKVSLSIVMGLGIFRAQELVPTKYNSLEVYLVLIAASIPTLRPLMGTRRPETTTYYNFKPKDWTSMEQSGGLDRRSLNRGGRFVSLMSPSTDDVVMLSAMDTHSIKEKDGCEVRAGSAEDRA
ncbi:integral membrane protein [Rutstroemia sp. NJR-2017a BVV2]|nr:integral membrane protein [Rutstroemia sp. NJR-2017a BVV2]